MITEILKNEFSLSKKKAKNLYVHRIQSHFNNLRDSLWIIGENNYVDKVYRDSYYHYYSSKLNLYDRDCVKLSLFEGKISEDDFSDPSKHENLQSRYRGFITLRPTIPQIIGRSIVSPSALKAVDFSCCTTKFHTTANGLKFTIKAFPHSSQDSETISCAETTLWAIMEYFSNKYSDYKPVLPSKIIQTLNNQSVERQLPSHGLNVQQMSFALREFGFGTKIYSKKEYEDDFKRLLNIYIESGLPLIIAMDNFDGAGTIGHAILAIGHATITDRHIDTLPAHNTFGRGIAFFDYAEAKSECVFIDDNCKVYQRAVLDNPAQHYTTDWHDCKITYFIVPLYPKIYLEAFEAKNFVLNFIFEGLEPIDDSSEVLLRFFLTSSRSYKDEIARNATIQDDLKSAIIGALMPKFIWVAELSTREMIKRDEAYGLVILDATEADVSYNKPLIIAAYQDKIINFDSKSKELEKIDLPLSTFKVFRHNLQEF